MFRMKTKITIVLLLTVFIVIILTSGCQENSTSNNKRARLIGNQNLELRKQLAAQIEKHQAELAECEAKAKKHELAGQQLANNTLNILKEFAELDKLNNELTAENKQLKEKIRKLELSNSQ